MDQNTILAIGTLLNIIFTAAIAYRKNARDNTSQFIDDIMERSQKQDDIIEKLEKKIEVLQEARQNQRNEITQLIRQSEREVNNWRESYYMSLSEYNNLKQRFHDLQNELTQLQTNYEILKTEHEALKAGLKPE